jgi:hypothetical protein
MKRILRVCALPAALLLLSGAACGQSGFPFQNETLRFAVKWASGVQLGEGAFTARQSGTGWEFEFKLDASVPGFAVGDTFRSAADQGLCSTEFVRNLSRGKRVSGERTVYDQKAGRARRTTVVPAEGGSSEFATGTCARDALTYFYYVRRELGQGRVAPAQQVFYGGAYTVKLTYAGSETVTIGSERIATDLVKVHMSGEKADADFDALFARDAARTPVLVRVPFVLGTFSLELVR